MKLECPKCNNSDIKKFTVNVIKPEYTYNCLKCEAEFYRDGNILTINIEKQLEDGRGILYFGKSLFMSRKVFDSFSEWDKPDDSKKKDRPAQSD